MLITDVKSLSIKEVKIVEFKKFIDARGCFTETYREDDFYGIDEMEFIRKYEFLQFNETFSRSNTFRGLHFQWSPFMGKLIRCISGQIIDLALDIRKDSKTFKKIVAYELRGNPDLTHSEWMWVPPGFAHGVLILEDSYMQYLCTGTYNPNCEVAISPISEDIDWSICDKDLKEKIDKSFESDILIKERDLKGITLKSWSRNKNSERFLNLEV